jgi:carbonic anhydrase
MNRIVMSVVAGGLAVSACTAVPVSEPHWSYSGHTGPENWSTLAPEYGACAGKNQSPVNLTGFIEAELQPIEISYAPGGHEIVNNGHTVQVSYAAGSSMKVDGIRPACRTHAGGSSLPHASTGRRAYRSPSAGQRFPPRKRRRKLP